VVSEGPDPFARIALTLLLSDALALVFIVGPGDRPVEGFAKIRAALPAESEILWHRVDRDGPAIASTLDQAKTPHPVVFVHGLERLPEQTRRETEVRLNLLRDAFSYRRAAVLFWVPSEVVDEFLLRCPDLYAWRSLMVVLSPTDVPVSEELQARRAFLARERTRLVQPLYDADVPFVLLEDSRATRILFTEWVSRVQRGILLGPAGSGKTDTLRSFALHQIGLAADSGDLSVPVPLFIAGHQLARAVGGDDRPQLSRLALLMDAPLTVPIEHWAKRGEVMLLLDGLDEVSPRFMSQVLAWLKRVAQEAPRMRLLVSSRPDLSLRDMGWEQATLARSPLEQRQRAILRVALDDDPTRHTALFHAVQEYLDRSDPDGLMTDPKLLGDLVGALRKDGRIPWSRAELLARFLGNRVRDGVRRVFRKTRIWPGEPLLHELRECAFHSFQESDDTFSRPALLKSLGLDTMELALRGERDQDLRYVLMTRAELLEDAGPDRYRFSRRLYRDFFAADALARRAEDEAVSGLLPHLSDVVWHDVIAFTTALRQKHTGSGPRFLERLWQESQLVARSARTLALRTLVDACAEAQLDAETRTRWLVQAEQELSAPSSPEEAPVFTELRAAAERLRALNATSTRRGA
jgi:hypothetical protein